MHRLKFPYTESEVLDHFEEMINTADSMDCPLCGLYYFWRHIEPCGANEHCPNCPMCETCNPEGKSFAERRMRWPTRSPEEQIRNLRELLDLGAMKTRACALCGLYDAEDSLIECHPGSELYCEDCPGCESCEAKHLCIECGWVGKESALRACHSGGEVRYCIRCSCAACDSLIDASPLEEPEGDAVSPSQEDTPLPEYLDTACHIHLPKILETEPEANLVAETNTDLEMKTEVGNHRTAITWLSDPFIDFSYSHLSDCQAAVIITYSVLRDEGETKLEIAYIPSPRTVIFCGTFGTSHLIDICKVHGRIAVLRETCGESPIVEEIDADTVNVSWNNGEKGLRPLLQFQLKKANMSTAEVEAMFFKW